MPIPGSLGTPLIAAYPGNPTSVAVTEFNVPPGTFVVDYSTPALWQKTSALGSNSGYNLVANASGALTPSSITSSGKIVSTSPSAGVGYATGAGGAVTQITSKATGVTLSKICGQITLNNSALGAGAEAAFTLTNTVIGATDYVGVCVASGGTSAAYGVDVTAVAAGSCEITVSNLTAGSLSEAIVLTFFIQKVVIA